MACSGGILHDFTPGRLLGGARFLLELFLTPLKVYLPRCLEVDEEDDDEVEDEVDDDSDEEERWGAEVLGLMLAFHPLSPSFTHRLFSCTFFWPSLERDV